MRYTLLTDGVTDANLIPIIDWALRVSAGVPVANGTHANLWRLPQRPTTLRDRLSAAADLFPCDALFVHRDAEREPRGVRVAEIQRAVTAAESNGTKLPAVAVIPVRMLEAWLLFSEDAIRKAAGNPNGRAPLSLPPLRSLEDRPDPKADLKTALRIATEFTGRRLKKFSTEAAFWRLVDFMDDFSSLRSCNAFRAFEDSLKRAAATNWAPGFYG